jgi:hypothetical protein
MIVTALGLITAAGNIAEPFFPGFRVAVLAFTAATLIFSAIVVFIHGVNDRLTARVLFPIVLITSVTSLFGLVSLFVFAATTPAGGNG